MAKMLYDDEIALPAVIDVSWAPVAGDPSALELGAARWLRTDESSWTISLDASGAGADAALIVVQQVVRTGDAGITAMVRSHDDQSAFPEISGQIQFDARMRNYVALHTLGSPAADSASLTLQFGGTGDVAFDVHALRLLRQWQIPDGVDTDWSLAYVDQSGVERADSGGVFATRRQVLRELSVSMRNREDSNVLLPAGDAGVMRILRGVGRSRLIMVIPREWDQPMDAEAAVAGYLVSDPEIDHVDGPLFSTVGLRIREAL